MSSVAPQNDGDPPGPKPERRGPFGVRRRTYIIVRVVIALGIVVVGVTLHHHGVVYDVIRGIYLVLIVSLIVWRVRQRRARRLR